MHMGVTTHLWACWYPHRDRIPGENSSQATGSAVVCHKVTLLGGRGVEELTFYVGTWSHRLGVMLLRLRLVW
jgi:hypothetical protein